MGIAVVIGSRNGIVAASVVALLATLALISPVWVGEATHAAQTSRAQAGVAYAHLPLAFEPNLGQFERHLSYVARGSGYSLLITRRSVVLNLAVQNSRRDPIGPSGRAATASITLAGANPDARLSAGSVLPGRVNYLVGADRSRWRTNVPTYARVRDENVWPGIDALFYGRQGSLEYDFDLAAGADPSRIGLALSGARRVRIDRSGDLVLTLHGGVVRQLAPHADQAGRVVAVRYVLHGDRVTLRLGAYDHALPLTIDPTLEYSTYLGGTGEDGASAVAVDGDGAAYVAGSTASTNFPTAPHRPSGVGPVQGGNRGGADAFVTKFAPDGKSLIYSTYLGGTQGDGATGIAIDSRGFAYVVGSTDSGDFPTTDGAFQTGYGGGISDAFVTKLDPLGTSLIYSSFLGGGGDDAGTGIAVDRGYAYISGTTDSGDFPVTPGAFQTHRAGDGAGFVTRLGQAGMHLVYSTYLGGSGKGKSSGAAGIALDNQDNAYVTGYTQSSFFPTTPDAFQPNFQGGELDAFVTRLAEDGSSVWYSTYLGGGQLDLGSAIAIDRFTGDAFVTGFTQSSDFPTTPGAFRTHSTANQDGFVTKLGPNGRNLGYSTYLGPSYPLAIAIDDGTAVDPSPAAFVTGSTDSPDYPTTSGAYQTGLRGTSGGFMTKLSPDGGALAYSTYLGGAKDDSAHGIALDPPAGLAYVVGSTSSDNFPTTADAYQRTNRGGPAGGGFGNEAFVTRFSLTPVAVTRLGRSGAVGTATLFGYVNAEGNQARYFYQYGTTDRYGSQTPNHYVDNDAFHFVSAGLSGLNPATTYHFRLVARNTFGVVYGRELTFTTPAAAPAASTGAANTIRTMSAALTGTVNPRGSTTSYHFEYGTSTAYGHTTASTGAGSDFTNRSVSAAVSGLRARTTYHYRIVASNSAGTTRGTDRTFTTTG